MERIVYRITLDAHKNGIQRTLQGFETGNNMSRQIAINLTASGDSYDIPLDHVVAMMYVMTPNATEPSINACVIEGNTILYDVLPTDIAEEGMTEMQLKLVNTRMDGARSVLVAPRFALEVTESNITDEGAEKTTTFTALEDAIARANEVYNSRITRVEIAEDGMFLVHYADGSVYENDFFKRVLYTGHALLAESYAHGNTGVRTGEDTDNASYYSQVARSASKDASKISEEARGLLEEARLKTAFTVFDVNFGNGNLVYASANYNFDVNEETGNLEAEGGENYDPEDVIEDTFGKYFAQETAERKAEIAVERARIDNIVALPEGSTTGDAELMDIRVGADGKTYASAGDAVRSQIGELSGDVERCFSEGWEDITNLLGSPANYSYSSNQGFFESELRYSLVGCLNKDILKGVSKIRITSYGGVPYSRQVFSDIGTITTIHRSELYNDTAWQTGETILELSQFENPVTFSVVLSSLSNELKIEIYGKNVVTPQTIYNDVQVLNDGSFFSGWENITKLLGEPQFYSYSKNSGYFAKSDRLALVGCVNKTVLKDRTKLKISAPVGVYYSRQLFSSAGTLTNIGNSEVFNDTSWQTGTTELDLTQFENVFTLGVLLKDPTNENNADITIKAFGEKVVSAKSLYSDIQNIIEHSYMENDYYDYIGEPIHIKSKFSNEPVHTFDVSSKALPIARTGQVQCFTFHNNEIIACFINGGIAIYNSDYTLKKEYALSDIGSDFHAANCFLYGTNADSEYPYLYVSETTGQRRCAVVSIEAEQATVKGWLSFAGKFGSGKDYFDWIYDKTSNHLFLVGYDNYARSNYHIIIKDLGVMPDDLTCVFNENNVVSTKHDYHVSVLQGGHFSNGRLFYACTGCYGEGLYVYDVYSNDPFKSFVPAPVSGESEGCYVKDGFVYYLFADGGFYRLRFM